MPTAIRKRVPNAAGLSRKAILTALEHGKSVVTANKQLISTHGVELLALARHLRRGTHIDRDGVTHRRAAHSNTQPRTIPGNTGLGNAALPGD